MSGSLAVDRRSRMPPRKSRLRPVAVTTTSASSSRAGLELDPALGEGLDAVGDDLGAAVGERLEEVGVGDQAEPLVPGVVARLEVGVDVVAGAAAPRSTPRRSSFLHQLRPAAAEPVDDALQDDVLPAHDRVGGAVRQAAAQRRWRAGLRPASRRRRSASAAASSPARPPRPSPGPASPRSRRCRSRRPACRRSRGPRASAGGGSTSPPKSLDPGELRRVALVVAVVAAADEEEAAGERHRLARVGALRLDRPARLLARPLGARRRGGGSGSWRSMPPSRAVVAHVVEDRLAVGDRLRRRSRAGSGSRACACRSRSGCPG